jgi:hypothetical protein
MRYERIGRVFESPRELHRKDAAADEALARTLARRREVEPRRSSSRAASGRGVSPKFNRV